MANDNKITNWKDREFGCLWKSENKANTLTGSFNWRGEEVRIMVSKNTFKEPGTKQPDYRVIFLGEEMIDGAIQPRPSRNDGQARPTSQPVRSAPAKQARPAARQVAADPDTL